MVGLVFHFEDTDMDVWSGRRFDFDAWHYTGKMFGVYDLLMVDRMTGGCPYDQKQRGDHGLTTVTKYSSLDEVLAKFPNQKRIWFETPWSFPAGVEPTLLKDLEHPADDVLYILGPGEGHEISGNDDRNWVTIPQLSTGAHHSIFIAPIILNDRITKLGLV